jgi:glutamate racemase
MMMQTADFSNTSHIFEGSIGVFDSGVGGLSVLRSIRQILPSMDLVYVADSLHAPYGEQTEAFIQERTLKLGLGLERKGVQAIVVACNTATVLAAKALRERTQLPVIAIEPAIKPAVAHTISGVVGVLATTQTTQSQSVKRLCSLYAGQTKILLQPCPGLVECIEAGLTQSGEVLSLLSQYVLPLVQQGADTLVLGCTHYSFLKDSIQRLVGKGISLIDPSDAVARELARRLSLLRELSALHAIDEKLLNAVDQGSYDELSTKRLGAIHFYTTGDLSIAQRVMSHLWGETIEVNFFNE